MFDWPARMKTLSFFDCAVALRGRSAARARKSVKANEVLMLSAKSYREGTSWQDKDTNVERLSVAIETIAAVPSREEFKLNHGRVGFTTRCVTSRVSRRYCKERASTNDRLTCAWIRAAILYTPA